LVVLVNGQALNQGNANTWSGGNKMIQVTLDIPAGVSGANTIELVTPAIPGVDSQISFVHSLTIDYTRQLDGSGPVTTINSGTQPKLFELSNVASAMWIVDARFPDRAALVPYEAQGQTIRFVANSGGLGQYLAVPAGQENHPLVVSKRQVKALKSNGTYLAVGPSQFSSGVQPLLLKHSKEGIKGTFVDQEQIFDYYGFGRYGPTAIQNAVRSVKPQYLLLVGRTTYDYKNYSGLNVDPLCPTFLVSTTSWAQATSDSQFGDLGRGYPEVAVGRLPVNNTTELGGIVNHILANPGLYSSGITVHAVADELDPAAGNFSAQEDAIAQANPEFTWQKNYLGITYATSPEVTAALKVAANGGADVLLYSGHGNAVRLGKNNPRIADTSTVQEWTGHSVFLQSTCTANWMAKDEAGYKSIAIQALTQPQGGISASIASSTYMNSDNAADFMNQLIKNANVSGMRWGNALMKTQQWAYNRGTTNGNGGGSFYSDLSKTEQIFGDPAMPVFAAPKASSASKAKAAPAAGQF
jgi:hypothetical protein